MALSQDDTLPKLLLWNSRKYGNRKVAMREKEYGIWQTYTWAQYLENVRYFAQGLSSLGFSRGDKLVIIGDNRPQLYCALMAAQCLGGIPSALYQDATANDVQYLVDHSDARFVMAEDQEQVDKLLEVKDTLPKVQQIIYDDPRGMRQYKDPFLMSFTQVQTLGQKFAKGHPEYFEEQVAWGQPDDIALIAYTSGTTGPPKGSILTHQNLIASARSMMSVEALRENEEWMACLPMAWIGDIFGSVVQHILAGFTINCPEKPETLLTDMREIGPTLFLAPPHIWETLVSRVQARIEDADLVKRKIYQLFMPIGQKVAALKMEKQPVPLHWRILYQIGDFFIYGPLRDHLGLRRTRYAYTVGSAISPEVFLFFRALGTNLKQAYGQTECSGFATIQQDGHVKPDTVGKPLPGVDIGIGENGEILMRGPGVFTGYYKDPQATAEVLKDGLLSTGDAGVFDSDGHLVVIGRTSDLSRLLDGTQFIPQHIENKLKFSPYIKEAVAVGQDRPFVVAMINIDPEIVGKWAENRGLSYTSYADLSQRPEVYDLIYREVVKVNQALPEALRVKKYVLLHKELAPDDGEITRTRQVRRQHIAQKYTHIISSLYTSLPELKLTPPMVYQEEGQRGTQASLRIQNVEELASKRV